MMANNRTKKNAILSRGQTKLREETGRESNRPDLMKQKLNLNHWAVGNLEDGSSSWFGYRCYQRAKLRGIRTKDGLSVENSRDSRDRGPQYHQPQSIFGYVSFANILDLMRNIVFCLISAKKKWRTEKKRQSWWRKIHSVHHKKCHATQTTKTRIFKNMSRKLNNI